MDPSSTPPAAKPSLFDRLSALLQREPEDRAELLDLLRAAHERKLLDADALSITEGALAASETTVRDVMIPRTQMDVIDIHQPLDQIVQAVIAATHSRFPLVDGDKDNVLGILLAKDLLRVQTDPGFNLRDWLRPAVFIPESKRLNVLLREFRASRNHMAIVVDEYGGVAGLVSIEDVLEQIVGDIEDEYDFDEHEDDIKVDQAGRYRVKAHTAIAAFNETFNTRFADDAYQTVGGMILHHLERVPKRNETVSIQGVTFEVLRADSRMLYTLLVTPALPNAE